MNAEKNLNDRQWYGMTCWKQGKPAHCERFVHAGSISRSDALEKQRKGCVIRDRRVVK
jgi:hypothetical protein